jgi:hypothetical protein
LPPVKAIRKPFLICAQITGMTIEAFKQLSTEQKLKELRFTGELLGSYDRNSEHNGPKTPGDIFALYDFWVYLSDDEEMIIPTRRNPLEVAE